MPLDTPTTESTWHGRLQLLQVEVASRTLLGRCGVVACSRLVMMLGCQVWMRVGWPVFGSSCRSSLPGYSRGCRGWIDVRPGCGICVG
jgi:hypothetical protein